ncbi:hypothetical protein [Glaciimonas sp. PCH181]|uniref:hypothetical protein n=1 Tax=Glaciimonas sp. PCH181 TaxID=2133943 RepID=UPI000D3CD8FF|nr:hypothetical protein [Glaciimonas sp. PCH181]PUA19152.1 hypothetical protein C7W93_04445 [Glaciimonas sp. PCH181]
MRISPSQVNSFLLNRGWIRNSIAAFPNTIVFTHRLFPDRQLFLPENESAQDYSDAVEIIINKLASIESKSFAFIAAQLESNNSEIASNSADSMSLRILKTVEYSETIPLSLANAAISNSEIMLLAGSCTAENPSRYFRRIDNKISNEIYNRAVFNHTRRGSFIMSISCTVAGAGEQLGLGFSEDSNDWTKCRRAFVAIYRSVEKLSTAILAGEISSFTEELLTAKEPVVSSNFCEALADLVAKDTGGGINFDFEWSPYIALPKDIRKGKSIFIDHTMTEDLYILSEALKPKQAALNNVFIGTVEALNGDVSISGEREGLVEFSILLKDGQKIRASANLNIEQYKLADHAHIGGAQYVSIEGILNPRARVWQFDSVKSFKLSIG